MTESIKELAQTHGLPDLPTTLLRPLRRQVLKLVDGLTTGCLRVTEADGRVTLLGNSAHDPLPVQVLDPRFYAYAAFGGSTGMGQAWMLGLWDTPELVAVSRLFLREHALMERLDSTLTARLRAPLYKWLEWRHRNTIAGSNRNISAHYDLGNDFFRLFLDDSMTYSAGVFADEATDLAAAQFAKYDLICRKLNLQPGQSVIEIGTGWGGFALHAAQHYGVHVTTTTISHEQHALAAERIRAAGLDDQVTLLKTDYRKLDGQFDHLVSIEMIEAVGHEFLPQYFGVVDGLLKPDGQALIQAITIQDQYYDQMRHNTDFIREYIFPGGHLPCVGEMLRVSGQHSSLRLHHLDDFGQDYARTLNLWRDAFRRATPQVAALGYPLAFRRMWDFYLASCEAGFLESTTSVVHAHFTKPRCLRGRQTAI